ncbi:hypothetical protein [uncultured Dubosiella sp.]|uniref:hypothetical protein n=1 Tax=uncultured Dubosiella sp. TaxID=1937011 RepID=UPI0032B20C1A
MENSLQFEILHEKLNAWLHPMVFRTTGYLFSENRIIYLLDGTPLFWLQLFKRRRPLNIVYWKKGTENILLSENCYDDFAQVSVRLARYAVFTKISLTRKRNKSFFKNVRMRPS